MQSEQNVFIQGEAGQLDIKHRPASDHQIGLLMCHPHPLFQGTMDNKVVTTVTRAAAELGLPTLRFNFRGVGKSEGEHDNGRGEQQDVLSVLKYAKEQLGWQKIILAGFSFGAGMACLAACEAPETVAKLLLVAPPVHHFDAPSQLPFEFETYVLMGNADDVVPLDRKSTRLNSSHVRISYAVFCLKKKTGGAVAAAPAFGRRTQQPDLLVASDGSRSSAYAARDLAEIQPMFAHGRNRLSPPPAST